jgi:hypothetical protein
MTQPTNNFPSIGAILIGPHWPARVRVVRVEPGGLSRVLIEAVTLDEQARLISRVFRRSDLANLEVEAWTNQSTLKGNPESYPKTKM